MKLWPVCFAPSAGCCGHRRNGNQKVDDIGLRESPACLRPPAEPRQAVDDAAEAGDEEARPKAWRGLRWEYARQLFGRLGAQVAPIAVCRTSFAPVHGPAAGALIEAYRAAGQAVELLDVPEEKA